MDYIEMLIETIALGVVTGAITFYVNKKNGKRIDDQDKKIEEEKENRKKIKEQAELESASLKNGVRSVLRQGIINSYEKAIDRGFIPVYEREAILSSYHDYKILGGNGTVDHLMEEMESVPTTPPIRIRRSPKSSVRTE